MSNSNCPIPSCCCSLILALIALATWLVPGGKYDTIWSNGKQLIDPASFHYIASAPQGSWR
jgi:uncharacterized ion transporter superfamily protein YfcC